MALMKEGVWRIVEGTEIAPGEGDAGFAKYVGECDRALAIVVLSIDMSLLYLIGEPSDQFMKKSWGNKLELRQKLHSLRLKEGHAVQEHIQEMTELFNALSEMDVPLTEDDRVVYLLASLPKSFSGLVTALEVSEDVPKMEIVTEKLLHHEVKLKVRGGSSAEDKKTMPAKWKKSKEKGPCHHCGKMGHFKRDCWQLKAKDDKHEIIEDSDEDALVVGHAFAARTSADWIIDSGATSHMCTSRHLFTDYRCLHEKVSGRSLEVVGRGTVSLIMKLPGGRLKRCPVKNALHVPDLS